MSINTENRTEDIADNPENKETEEREGFETITEWSQLGELRRKGPILIQFYVLVEKRFYMGILDSIREKMRSSSINLYLKNCYDPTLKPIDTLRYRKSEERGRLDSIRMIRDIELGKLEYKIME